RGWRRPWRCRRADRHRSPSPCLAHPPACRPRPRSRCRPSRPWHCRGGSKHADSLPGIWNHRVVDAFLRRGPPVFHDEVEMVQKTIPEEKARQGRWGWQILAVLVGGLVLAMIAWYAAETFGEAIDESPPVQQITPEAAPATPETAPAN